MAAVVGQAGLYHLTGSIDRPCVVMNVNGDSTYDVHIFVDPDRDAQYWAGDTTLVRVERNIAQGTSVGQFT